MFDKIPMAKCLINNRGYFTESDLFEREGRVYCQFSEGYCHIIERNGRHETSSGLVVEEINSGSKTFESDKMGYLRVARAS